MNATETIRMEEHEDYTDVQVAVKAIDEYEKNPVSYTLEEVIEMNGDGDLLEECG